MLLSSVFTLRAAADQVSLEPSMDAFVCDCVPGTTNPMLGNQYLAQGRYSACYNRTFISWDLSSIPAGSTIDDAEFRIYCCQFYGAPSGQMVVHSPQRMQIEASMTALLFDKVMASTGQSFTQLPQSMHFSCMMHALSSTISIASAGHSS